MRSQVEPSSKTAVLLFLAALFVLPLIVSPTISLNFNDVFLNIKAIWTLAVILPSTLYLIFRLRVPPDRVVQALMGFWVGWLVLAAFLNHSGFLALTGAPDRLQGLPVYLTYGLVALAAFALSRRFQGVPPFVLPVLSGLMVPLGLYVALQYYGVVGVLNADASGGVLATVAGATLGQRGYLSGCVALLLPLMASFAARSRWGLVYLVLAGFSLTAALTRGALLAALMGYLWWAFQGNLRRVTLHGALLLGLALPLVHLTASQASLRDFGTEVGEQQATDSSGRTPLWNTALYGIRSRPAFGWGPGQLLNVMATRPDREVLTELHVALNGRKVRRLPRQPGTALGWRITTMGAGGSSEGVYQPTNAVHNEYLEYAFTYGIPAALAFVCLFLLGIWRSWRTLPWASAALVSYLVYLFTWPETVRFAALAWAILGMALAAIRSPRVSAVSES